MDRVVDRLGCAGRRHIAGLAFAAIALGACVADAGPPVISPPEVTELCRVAACDPLTGLCEVTFAADGAACDDGDACTSGDVCRAGACITTPVSCDDGNACTDDACDPASGCGHTANTSPCDDGDACTTGDTCEATACVGAAVTCDDGEACTADACDPAVGCVAPFVEGHAAWCSAIGAQCPVGFVCQDGAVCVSCDGAEHFVPQGRTWMGCDPSRSSCPAVELPFHRVVTGPYVIQPTEVTAAAWDVCVEAGACTEPVAVADEPAYATWGVEGKERHPVAGVTWRQARDYCAWLGADEGRPWRLCSESEWEKAARGACVMACDRDDDDGCCRLAMPTWPWGETPATCERAVMQEATSGGNGCGAGVSAEVGSRPAGRSPFRLDDMAGNLWEWVADCWEPSFEDAPADGSARASCGPTTTAGDLRVIRGGSFGLGAADLRATSRTYHPAGEAYAFFGFRCCRTLD